MACCCIRVGDVKFSSACIQISQKVLPASLLVTSMKHSRSHVWASTGHIHTFQVVCQALGQTDALKAISIDGFKVLVLCHSCASVGKLARLLVICCACRMF